MKPSYEEQVCVCADCVCTIEWYVGGSISRWQEFIQRSFHDSNP